MAAAKTSLQEKSSQIMKLAKDFKTQEERLRRDLTNKIEEVERLG